MKLPFGSRGQRLDDADEFADRFEDDFDDLQSDLSSDLRSDLDPDLGRRFDDGPGDPGRGRTRGRRRSVPPPSRDRAPTGGGIRFDDLAEDLADDLADDLATDLADAPGDDSGQGQGPPTGRAPRGRRAVPPPEAKAGGETDDPFDDPFDYDPQLDEVADEPEGVPAPARRADGGAPPPPEHHNHRTPGGTNAVAADEFADQMERLRSEASAEQRSAWAYLGVLTGLFVFLVGFGYGCSDQGRSDVATGEMTEVMESGEPARLLFRIEGDIITLQGTVPSEAARGQLVGLAQSIYGPGNVIEELVVDGAATFDAGTVRTVGSATFDDERSSQLHSAVRDDFGLEDRGFEVGLVETVLTPAAAQVEVDEQRVTLSGALPDEQSVADLVALAGEVWGPENVDGSGLSVGSTTWTEGRIRVSGTVLSTDVQVDEFVSAVPERFGLLVLVDRSGLATVDVTALLSAVQGQINELLTSNPIQFAPLSADIDPASDGVLVELAELLNQVEGNEVEIVGHTDSVGDEQENLLLSQDRARAVLDRLVELGVDAGRLTSRGEGEANPIADNGTDEGRALNRRIEFVFVGTTDVLDGDQGSTTTTTTG